MTGTITATTGVLSGNIKSLGGSLGHITLGNGMTASAEISASTSIAGNITIHNGGMAGIIKAADSIDGNVSIVGGITGIIQTGPNSIGNPSPDLNQDNIVNISDFAILAQYWLEPPPLAKFYDLNLDTDPGWSAEGEWAFGLPTGGGGIRHGYPDPLSGYTGSNVYGVNLSGDYSISPSGPHYLTAGPFNCTNHSNIHLLFARWLNSDIGQYVPCTVEVSNNGADWQLVWENGVVQEITEDSWKQLEYDISAIADGEPTVYIRWSYQIIDGAYDYSGWNIDDVELWGN